MTCPRPVATDTESDFKAREENLVLQIDNAAASLHHSSKTELESHMIRKEIRTSSTSLVVAQTVLRSFGHSICI